MKMSDESRGPKKGESAGVVVTLVKFNGQYFLPLPTEITDGLGWGETQGCVIRNLTKEIEDE